MTRKIVTAFDHAGFELRETVHKTIRECGWDVLDVGTDSAASVDFPDYAWLGAQKIMDGEAEKGIFVCGSGIGMSLAANKIPGIYAAVCHDVYSAHQAVEHDEVNVLCLGSRVIGSEKASEMIRAYLKAEFNDKPNQVRRMGKIRQIESGTYSQEPAAIRLKRKGQSLWLNSNERETLDSEEMKGAIQRGEIRGSTFHPRYFLSSLQNDSSYRNAVVSCTLAGLNSDEIFTQITAEDIRRSADKFRDLFVATNGEEGYAGHEIDPRLADDTQAIVDAARKLWTLVNRPNVMIKIPATEAALPAITELTAKGINLNITPVFSEKYYRAAADAYIAGLDARLAEGQPIDKIRSVVSVFVGRIDRKIDPMLNDEAASLRGQAAIRNAQRIYNSFLGLSAEEHTMEIEAKGAKPLRLLWTSMSPRKLPCPPSYYVEALIGPDTICSVHPELFDAIQKNLTVNTSLPVPQEEIDAFFAQLTAAGVDFDELLSELESEGSDAFRKAYDTMLEDIEKKSEMIRIQENALKEALDDTYQKIESESILPRMFAKDPTVWTFDTSAFAEIRNRLGWLDTYTATEKALPNYVRIRESLKADGIKKILLLGMGGSSLCPEVLSLVFDAESDLKLEIVDSTDPDQVLAANASHDPKETVYIVSSKSGSTAEVRAFLDYFFGQATEKLGEEASAHFIAITDPGTGLERTATEMKFREIILSDASVGGRFSALTPFGVAPAVLMGLDGEKIMEKASRMAKNCSPSTPISRNEGLALGAFMGTAALNGMDKVCLITEKGFESFGSWLEQLIAESSGKNGKGIVPVDIEPEAAPADYSSDRTFVYVRYGGEKQEFVDAIAASGHPVFTITLGDLYDIFAEFYRWEIAISVACALLEVNTFDQPNVQDSKTRTVAKVNEYHEKGELVQPAYNWSKNGVSAYYTLENAAMDAASDAAALVKAFIAQAQKGTDYIAINAYLPRNAETLAELQKLREMILATTGCATTLGFGPRFQHSTGQLHKGGANNGLFIQLVWDSKEDAEIPNEDIRFSVLERAQALGDFESLLANGRRAVRIDLGKKGMAVLG